MSSILTTTAGVALAAALASSPALPRLAALLTGAPTVAPLAAVCVAGHCWTALGGVASPAALPPWLLAAVAVFAGAIAAVLASRARPVYLVDFAVFRPPDELKCTKAIFTRAIDAIDDYTESSRAMMKKVIETSGVGEEAAMPAIMHAPPPWRVTMAACREEAEMVMFDVVEAALAKTGLTPASVDCLIVNCSIFCPTPSLAAMLVNKFKFRPDCITYNLGGMGCSASPIAVDLARELLGSRPRSRALVVSTENITHNLYTGNYKPMLVAGCIFRLGGAAIVLSNHPADARAAKYDLRFVARTNAAGNDEAYGAVYECQDEAGVRGVRLSKDLMRVAGATLRANITKIGPLVLPLGEQARFAANLVRRKILRHPIKPYVPDFTKAFDHFCLHTGGRAVIDAMEAQLALPPARVRPSKEALRRYGNTSSASIWYVLAWIESLEGVRAGDRVWQIAFGSGFKVNSAVWTARRAITTGHAAYADWAPAEGDGVPERRV